MKEKVVEKKNETYARLASGKIVKATVLNEKRIGFLFKKNICLVYFKHNIVDGKGKALYTNTQSEWVPEEDVFIL